KRKGFGFSFNRLWTLVDVHRCKRKKGPNRSSSLLKFWSGKRVIGSSSNSLMKKEFCCPGRTGWTRLWTSSGGMARRQGSEYPRDHVRLRAMTSTAVRGWYEDSGAA